MTQTKLPTTQELEGKMNESYVLNSFVFKDEEEWGKLTHKERLASLKMAMLKLVFVIQTRTSDLDKELSLLMDVYDRLVEEYANNRTTNPKLQSTTGDI